MSDTILDCGATPSLTCQCVKCTEYQVQWRGFPKTVDSKERYIFHD
jgi:hypothetical protein